jgi:hypothetical protein
MFVHIKKSVPTVNNEVVEENNSVATTSESSKKRALEKDESTEEGCDSKKSKSTPVLRQSWASLDEEHVEEDRAWIQGKARYTDNRNKQCTVEYPTWSVIGKKYAGLEYEFGTGNVSIFFRQYGEKPACVKLDLFEWADFNAKFRVIQELIQVVEGKKTDKTPVEVFNGATVKEFKGWKQMEYKLNNTLKLVLKWNEETKGVLVILNRGRNEQVPDKNYMRFVSKPEDSILIGATGADYLTRFLENPILNGIRMWTNVRNVGHSAWQGCFLLPENKPEALWPSNASIFTNTVEEDILAQSIEEAMLKTEY